MCGKGVIIGGGGGTEKKMCGKGVVAGVGTKVDTGMNKCIAQGLAAEVEKGVATE